MYSRKILPLSRWAIWPATGECEASIAKAYVTARDLFDIEAKWRQIESLDYQISSAQQNEMFAQLVRLVRRSTRWLLRSRRTQLEPARELMLFSDAEKYLADNVGQLLQGQQSDAWAKKVAAYVESGVPVELAEFVASARYLYATFAIAEAAQSTGAEFATVANCYFDLGERLELNWFADQIVQMRVENYWQALARESFRDELETQQATLTCTLMEAAFDRGEENLLEQWFEEQNTYIDRWQHMMAELRCAAELDLAMFPVAIRELLDLTQASQQAA